MRTRCPNGEDDGKVHRGVTILNFRYISLVEREVFSTDRGGRRSINSDVNNRTPIPLVER